jgi:hypothetical protein
VVNATTTYSKKSAKKYESGGALISIVYWMRHRRSTCLMLIVRQSLLTIHKLKKGRNSRCLSELDLLCWRNWAALKPPGPEGGNMEPTFIGPPKLLSMLAIAAILPILYGEPTGKPKPDS